jgi:hypothetical protein
VLGLEELTRGSGVFFALVYRDRAPPGIGQRIINVNFAQIEYLQITFNDFGTSMLDRSFGSKTSSGSTSKRRTELFEGIGE